jgi:hypothetical protein
MCVDEINTGAKAEILRVTMVRVVRAFMEKSLPMKTFS